MRRSFLVTLATLALSAASACGGGPSGGEAREGDEQLVIGIAEIAVFDVIQENVQAFKDGLAERGLVEGEDVRYETKNAQGELANVNLVARQLVQEEPDLIYALGTPLIEALANETTDIPIVFGVMTDPVGSGVAESVDRPGGNLTGTSDFIAASTYFAFLEQLVPDAETIGFIGNTGEQNTASSLEDFQAESEERGLTIEVAPVSATGDIVPALRSLRGRVDAVTFTADNTVVSALDTVAQTALDHKLPLIGATAEAADGGALLGLGLDWATAGEVAAEQAADILEGEAEPGEIPVWFAEEEGLVVRVNTDTADQLGIELPPGLLENAETVP